MAATGPEQVTTDRHDILSRLKADKSYRDGKHGPKGSCRCWLCDSISEIERLRAELKAEQDAGNLLAREKAGLEQWSERLRAALEQIAAIALREEILGQPIFSNFCGPMYDGDGIVRYEDADTNNLLST